MNRRMLGLARGIQDIPGGWVVQSRAVHIVRSGHRGEASMLSMQYVVRVDKGGQVCVCVCVCVCGWGCVGGCVCVCVCVWHTHAPAKTSMGVGWSDPGRSTLSGCVKPGGAPSPPLAAWAR